MARNRILLYSTQHAPYSKAWLPRTANWTAYPEWAFQGYYRENPGARRNGLPLFPFSSFGTTRSSGHAWNGSAKVQLDGATYNVSISAGRGMGSEPKEDRPSSRDYKSFEVLVSGGEDGEMYFIELNEDGNFSHFRPGYDVNTYVPRRVVEQIFALSKAKANRTKRNPWVDEDLPQNGGPYTPNIFPYGQGARPKVWKAKSNAVFPRATEKVPNQLKVGDVIVGKRPGSPFLRNLHRVVSLRRTAKRLKVTIRLMGMWQPGAATYSDLEYQGTPPAEIAFTERQAEQARLTVLSQKLYASQQEATKAEMRTVTAQVRKKLQQARANRGLKPVPAKVKRTPREGWAESISAVGDGKRWPIGDLYHAKTAVKWVVKLKRGKKSELPKILAAVRRHYPQYDWSAYIAELRGSARKNSGARLSTAQWREVKAPKAERLAMESEFDYEPSPTHFRSDKAETFWVSTQKTKRSKGRKKPR